MKWKIEVVWHRNKNKNGSGREVNEKKWNSHRVVHFYAGGNYPVHIPHKVWLVLLVIKVTINPLTLYRLFLTIVLHRGSNWPLYYVFQNTTNDFHNVVKYIQKHKETLSDFCFQLFWSCATFYSFTRSFPNIFGWNFTQWFLTWCCIEDMSYSALLIFP